MLQYQFLGSHSLYDLEISTIGCGVVVKFVQLFLPFGQFY